MATIAQIAKAINTVFNENTLEELARTSGFTKRKVVINGPEFVETLIMAFQANKTASYSEMSGCASSLGMPVTAQGIEQRFTESSSQFMKAVLEHALTIRVKGVAEQNIPMLKRFKAVHIRDSSIISLPEELKYIWKGAGGGQGENSALKLQVSWEQCSGSLDGITLQDGYCQDRTSPYQNMEMDAGELHIADLGYYSLEKLAADDQKGIFWLTRLKFKTLLWNEQGIALDLLTCLKNQTQNHWEIPVYAGKKKQVRCRLLISRVPKEVAEQRRYHIKDHYRRQRRQPSAELLKMADWTLVLTNVPKGLLSLKEALVLLKIRWQIELLFKLWKSYLSIDQWNSKNSWRILTEIYTKLLIAILFHWTMLADFWQYPNRSMIKAFKVFQYHSMIILMAVGRGENLFRILDNLSRCYAKSCLISRHSMTACTFQALLSPEAVLC